MKIRAKAHKTAMGEPGTPNTYHHNIEHGDGSIHRYSIDGEIQDVPDVDAKIIIARMPRFIEQVEEEEPSERKVGRPKK